MAIAKSRASKAGDWGINLVLVLLAIFMLAPFWWVLVNSFSTYADAVRTHRLCLAITEAIGGSA